MFHNVRTINIDQILHITRVTNRRRWWHPTPVFLPGKSHGWRSLVGCSPWGREESDMTEWLHFHFSLSCIGEGNGNPLQCSCLENPRDGGAWWAAVYGVAQSRTRLSSSNIEKTVMEATRAVQKSKGLRVFTYLSFHPRPVTLMKLLKTLSEPQPYRL